jgi:hypothetical protein
MLYGFGMQVLLWFGTRIPRQSAARGVGAVAALLIGTTILAGCIEVPATGSAAGGLYGSPYRPAYASVAPVPMIQPVVQPADGQMTCDQLMAASSSMDQVIANESMAARQQPDNGMSNAVMRTAASMAAGALSGFAPGASYLAPAAMGLQQQQITQQQIQAQSQSQSESQAQMAINNAEQRKMYLATLMQQKKCGQTAP